MWKQDPFSGHIVIRSTDAETPGSAYRLWTTLKVPQGFSMTAHCDLLTERIGADAYRIMPAKRLFALGVGHVRRRGIEPGSKTDELGPGARHEHRRAERPRLARARAAQARVRGRRDRRRSVGRARRRGRTVARRIPARRAVAQRARRHRPLLDVPRAREAVDRRNARHALQRAVPLARAGGPRDRSGTRGRTPSHSHARVLARGRARVRRT